MLAFALLLCAQDPAVPGAAPEAAPAPAPVAAPPSSAEVAPAAPDVAVDPIDVASGDEELLALEEQMVTTASGTVEPVRTAPASVTIITARELRAFGYQSTADALLGVRGLYQTDDKFYTSLGVRGFNRFGDYGNRVQVQMDGHVMNDDWIFSSYIGSDQFTDIAHVEEIEVVRGPGSALYGTGAFFGVVNLETPTKAPPYHVRAGGGVVDTNTYRLHVDGGHQYAGGIGFWASAGMSTLPPRDYRSAEYEGTPWAPDGVARGADAFSTGSVIAKAWYGDFVLEGSLHQRNRRMPAGHFDVVYGDVRNQADDRRGFLELRYEPQLLDWLKLRARAYADHQAYDAHYADLDPAYSPASESFSSEWFGSEGRLEMKLFDTVRVTPGVQAEAHPLSAWVYKDNPVAEPALDQHAGFYYLSAFAVADWAPFSWLAVSGGARFDGWIIPTPVDGEGASIPDEPSTGFLWSLNPRAAIVWSPTDTDTLKAMGGRAYRVPSIYELTYSNKGFDFTGGNPNEPETIYTAEVEYRRVLPFKTTAIASVYGNLVNDLLNYVVIDAENVDGYENVDQAVWTVGAEIELRHDVAEDVLAAVQYSFQETRFDTPFTGEVVPNSPNHLIGAWLIVPIGTPLVTLANRVVFEAGRRDRNLEVVDPSVRWDAMLTGRLEVIPMDVNVGIKNVLDWKIESPVSDRLRDARVPEDGRTLRAEVMFHL